jgi:hypothetical protein
MGKFKIRLNVFTGLFLGMFILIALNSCGVFKKSSKKKTAVQMQHTVKPVAKSDSLGISRPKPFKDIIPSKIKGLKGLFTVYQVGEKYYFEIPDSLFGRDILVVTRYSKNAAGTFEYAGEEVNEQSIRWEKGPLNKIFLRAVLNVTSADSTNEIFKSVEASSVNPIIGAFDIKALKKDSLGVVIEVTDFLKGDNVLTGYDPQRKKKFGITSLIADRSYISSIKSYPVNTEVRTVKTYNVSPNPETLKFPAGNEIGVTTMELNSSFVLLPKIPMEKRLYDPRVGYFASYVQKFGDDQQKVENELFIHRWRLEPKPEDWDKWKKGELVEPAKPIVYYLDPATPKKWRPYLIAGINEWQKAFEKIGFKNAIVGKEWPENDTTMSLEDARYSVVRYLASPISNAYGPNVADPRSGEILESHIGWFHNVIQLVHDWYMIQAGAIDPRTHKMVFDDELMGKLLQFVIAHEVGHTLGLRHNMGSSSLTPVEKLRDNAWLEKNGFCPSIMDYARFNYVAQPEDKISEAGIFPRIGDYDCWAIRWGYTPITETKDQVAESKILNKWIIDSLKNNPRLWFGGEGFGSDPRAQTEDIGDNSMKASEYGIKNLKRIITELPKWSYEENDKYDNLQDLYGSLISQFSQYMGHVIRNIGGVYTTYKSIEQPGDIYSPTPKNIQKEAMSFLDKQLFQTPEWLLNKEILNKIYSTENPDYLERIQLNVLSSLLSSQRLLRMSITANRFSPIDTYSPLEFMEDLKGYIWTELKTHKEINYQRRNLQKRYLSFVFNLLSAPPANVNSQATALSPYMRIDYAKVSDVTSVARSVLAELRSEITAALPAISDKISKSHLQDVLASINLALNPKG